MVFVKAKPEMSYMEGLGNVGRAELHHHPLHLLLLQRGALC